MRRYWFPKRYADAVARLRVPSGFLLVVAFAWFSDPSARSLWLGVPVSVAGLALRAWAAGCLAKNRDLATAGPYAWVRNPLYIGTLLVALGLVIASQSIGLGILFAAVFLLIYLPVIELEEQHLRSIFPEYAAYAARVPALLPKIPSASAKKSNPFHVQLYLKNQEYQALAGFMVGLLFLLWKAN
jgi:protein-S-isoprenylcysteine O-methyltransferase Ste14